MLHYESAKVCTTRISDLNKKIFLSAPLFYSVSTNEKV